MENIHVEVSHIFVHVWVSVCVCENSTKNLLPNRTSKTCRNIEHQSYPSQPVMPRQETYTSECFPINLLPLSKENTK